jgi:hypothetical protein
LQHYNAIVYIGKKVLNDVMNSLYL